MSKRYHTALGFNNDSKRWEILFGSFVKSEVIDEIDDIDASSDEYMSFTIITTSDAQADIVAKVKELNHES